MPEEEIKSLEGDFLVPLETYLSNGVHVGLKYKTKFMKEFIYKTREDKLSVFDVRKIDERLRIASKFISRYEPEKVLAVSNRIYGRRPIRKFSEYTGCMAISDRFVSGTLTNPAIPYYMEPDLLIVTDPSSDKQAIKEASIMGIPVIAVCDTNARINDIDFIIPANNKGKNSIALIFWILTKEVLRLRGIEDFNVPLEEFISKEEPQPYLIKMHEIQKKRRRRRK
ncbi:MAG TPA: 30S ribosomal protein S2 [Candidatus Altiarchaeales archaeon]|nr:30S ribosomal protein S2 [Candidatus Altiarchaeales archaeon]